MAYELIKSVTTPAGLFYLGHAEEATFEVTLPPEELPGVSWFANKITEALVEAAAGEGQILKTQTYFDSGGWYYCKYLVIAVGHGSPLAWAIIVPMALVIVGLSVVAWMLHTVKDRPWLGAGLVAVGIGAGAIGVSQLVKEAKK